jgi:Protein of unknown function (DUF2911)
MNSRIQILSLAMASTLAFTPGLFAQAPKVDFPAPSPGCTLKQRVGLTDIEIVYSRPSMKGRKIFSADGLVPYGQVWRTGANNATKITFSKSVKLNGVNIPAGSYSIFTIPGENEWTIIINKTVGQSGTQYDEKADLVRFKTTSITLAEHIETFLIDFNDIRDESATINLIWDDTVVPIKLDVALVSELLPQIETAMAAEGASKPYYQAAMFYYDHGQDLQKASKWIDAAIAQRDAHYMEYLKANILAKLGDKKGAIAASKRSTELAIKAKDTGYVKMNEDLIASLK